MPAQGVSSSCGGYTCLWGGRGSPWLGDPGPSHRHPAASSFRVGAGQCAPRVLSQPLPAPRRSGPGSCGPMALRGESLLSPSLKAGGLTSAWHPLGPQKGPGHMHIFWMPGPTHGNLLAISLDITFLRIYPHSTPPCLALLLEPSDRCKGPSSGPTTHLTLSTGLREPWASRDFSWPDLHFHP